MFEVEEPNKARRCRMIPKPSRIRGRRGKEYVAWRQGYLARHPGRQRCEGVWKKGERICDCPRGLVGEVYQDERGIWRTYGLDVGHKRGRSTHFGASAKMTDEGVYFTCPLCNATSAGNKIIDTWQ
jgi:hypothetical protein